MNLFEELAAYTGRNIELVRQRCRYAAYELAWQWPEFKDNPIEFYRTTDLYLYDLTQYQTEMHDTGWHHWFKDALKQIRPKRILDFGGGIGEYTINAWGAGFPVDDFLEVARSSTMKYAIHRMRQHGCEPAIRNEEQFIGSYDLIIAMDVLEHLPDPQPRIIEFAQRTKYLIANTENLPNGVYFPQHISKPDLHPYFKNIGGDLWEVK